MKIRFTIPGAPRTAKNSPTLVGGRFPQLVPSPYYRAWFAEAMSYAPVIKGQIIESARQEGVVLGLPIVDPVSVAAIIYREDATKADLVNYLQAVSDWLQMPNQKRNGAGIIVDDDQIRDYDGSRRAIDRTSPRIEVCMTVIDPAQERLFERADYVYGNPMDR